jgi:flagellin
MALGVLNNLSAIYAENNLNNTSNSLQTVLQQLSSGSRINSGSDDAAGLSLVNGLAANSAALTQSKTNATEGVGLLQVADGALSQVTTLLNRAITLATEASNGTLNTSQESAANQEYQSILSEINNIGQTTTYNQETVFNGENVAIYTGDSSTTGSSIDNLNIRSLSSSNVGDSDGKMAYSTGSSGNNVFVDLTNNATTSLTDKALASINDTLNSSGTTSITITTLSSTGTNVINTITVGGASSGYSNTAQGMISAINDKNLGVTASWSTAAVAGATSSTDLATDTGIMLTGSVGSGTTPSQNSYSGEVGATDNTTTASTATKAGNDIVSGSISLQVGSNATTTVTTAQVATANSEASGAVTMAQVAAYITANAGLGVTASIDTTNGALKLTSTNSTAALKVTSNLTDNTLKTSSAVSETTSYTATSAYSVGVSTDTIANNGITDSNIGNATLNATATAATWTDTGTAIATATHPVVIAAGTPLTGKMTITDGASGSETLDLGSASEGTDSLGNLAATINKLGTTGGLGGTSLGYTATTDGAGNLTITQTGTTGTSTPSTTPIHVAIAANAAGNAQTGTTDTVATGGSSTSGGTATISYTDKAGTSLSGTDLSTQADAQIALTTLNSAITSVAAQDGYIGAQINTLNSISQVMSTQQENVVSAQNAIQATDYASATANMSKYEILSQTGIAALAQANSVQQEVTKLLQ